MVTPARQFSVVKVITSIVIPLFCYISFIAKPNEARKEESPLEKFFLSPAHLMVVGSVIAFEPRRLSDTGYGRVLI